nr:hypothetical protein [Tanacetum cinerariifolium]
ESSNDSSGLVPIDSPTLSLFHDDPYMKNSSFLRNYCHLRNKDVTDHSSSTSAIPQEFKIGESSRKTSLERHEEQIKEILNHLDELSLSRIENIKENIEGLRKGRVTIQQDFDNLETELQETQAQVAKLQRMQLGKNNKISLARFRITDLEQIIKESKLVNKHVRKVSWIMPPKRTSTSATPAMTQDGIRKLVANNVTVAL